ncbi:MAG: GGDEF domain-containing protein [Uliginosibacterium sp.]|nr:GGDEF domain-containing protein [Uliginosibacterium sp.]
MADSPETPEVRTAKRALLRLEQRTAATRGELTRLRSELAAVRLQRELAPASVLVAANEQLVISALQADSLAETAKSELSELARTSQRDALTDTPNRALMLDRLKQAIATAKRNSKRFAVLFLDLDKFKLINDSLGHATGDEVLKLTARRVESVLRHSDTVSRHGGDEFLVLLADVNAPADAAKIAAKMLAAICADCEVCSHRVALSASIGIALYPEDALEAAELIDHADAAMYHSKKQGPGGFGFYAKAQG